MRVTFTLPSGNKVRTSTVRSFVLIFEDSTGAWTEMRSDDTRKLTARADRARSNGSRARMYYGAAATGEVRDQP